MRERRREALGLAPASRRPSRPRGVGGFPRLFARFLSCDARDMVRVTPALARNHMALAASTIRMIAIFLGITSAYCDRVAWDVYWASRTDHPDFAERFL